MRLPSAQYITTFVLTPGGEIVPNWKDGKAKTIVITGPALALGAGEVACGETLTRSRGTTSATSRTSEIAAVAADSAIT